MEITAEMVKNLRLRICVSSRALELWIVKMP